MYEINTTAALTLTTFSMAILVCTDAILQYVLANCNRTTYGDVLRCSHAKSCFSYIGNQVKDKKS
jgi:hypothetical protein